METKEELAKEISDLAIEIDLAETDKKETVKSLNDLINTKKDLLIKKSYEYQNFGKAGFQMDITFEQPETEKE